MLYISVFQIIFFYIYDLRTACAFFRLHDNTCQVEVGIYNEIPNKISTIRKNYINFHGKNNKTAHGNLNTDTNVY